MGSQLTKNYEVERDPKSEGGIGSPWKIYSATRRDRDRTPVSIFIFDKRALDKKTEKNDILNRLKAEINALIKLRHPNVLQILEPMLEDKTTIAWVTEPLEYCLGDLLRRPHILSACLGDTEARLGILDAIQGLSFLHNEARLVHMAVCPDNLYISQGGKWKIGGLNFSSNYNIDGPAKLDPSVDIITSAKAFRYQIDLEKLAPLMHFSAPELVAKQSAMPAADIFSLGCSVYSIYKALSNTSSDLLLLDIDDFSAGGHKTAAINASKSNNVAFNCLPEFMAEIVIKMLMLNPGDRAGLHELSISRSLQTPYVKTIYYLEHLQEKQDAQKMQFFKGLTSIIDKFDRVIMNKRLLPALVANMQHPNLTPFILPSILTILKSCEITKELFQTQIWPSIAKLATGKEIPAQSFFLLLNEIDLLIKYTDIEAYKKCLMPLVFKGYECGVGQIQNAIMSKTPQLMKELQDSNYVRTQILPRFLQGIINSKASSVKETGLKALSLIYNTFDRPTMIDVIIPSLEKFKKFDITGMMVMHLLDIYEGISKSLGHKATAINILPALLPLLVDAELTKSEFERLFISVTGMLNHVREARTGELADGREEQAIENLRNEDIEEVNDIFRDIFDVGGKPIMEAQGTNNEVADIFNVEVAKNEPRVERKQSPAPPEFKAEVPVSNYDIKPVRKDPPATNPGNFSSDFSYKKPDPLPPASSMNQMNFISYPSNQKAQDFTFNKPDPPKPSPGIDDIFGELANIRPKEEAKNKLSGMSLKPPPTQGRVNNDPKPGPLRPQMKKPNNPVPINTDDFFNELLNVGSKKDPFAGL